MKKMESPCGCGCIDAKPSINKTAKKMKAVEDKEAKNQQNKKTK
jgi:hypothetical protein